VIQDNSIWWVDINKGYEIGVATCCYDSNMGWTLASSFSVVASEFNMMVKWRKPGSKTCA
jgi:hypothetical protein